MSKEQNRKERVPTVRILLDGEPVTMPGKALGRLSSVRAQLELLALRQDRILTALWVDGVAVNLEEPALEGDGFSRVEAQSITFGELGLSMLATVREEARQTAGRIQEAGARVLINPWPAAHAWVVRLEDELRTLLLVVTFIEEICGEPVASSPVDLRALRAHLQGLDYLRLQLQAAARRREVADLSDFLVMTMAPWAEQLVHLLESNHE